jgi:hypothetical protein
MKLKLSVIAVLAIITPTHLRAATLTDAEATFLDQLVTAAAVLAQRCAGYEANGAGGVRLGASRLGSPDAAMAMIAAFDAAIKAHDESTTTEASFALKFPKQPAKRPAESWQP